MRGVLKWRDVQTAKAFACTSRTVSKPAATLRGGGVGRMIPNAWWCVWMSSQSG